MAHRRIIGVSLFRLRRLLRPTASLGSRILLILLNETREKSIDAITFSQSVPRLGAMGEARSLGVIAALLTPPALNLSGL
jgi:hypothetical protein